MQRLFRLAIVLISRSGWFNWEAPTSIAMVNVASSEVSREQRQQFGIDELHVSF